MARATLKSQSIVIAQLTAQVAELTTQLGVLMNALEESNQLRSSLQDERDDLIIENRRLVESTIAAHERCDVLEAMVAKPNAPAQATRKPAPVTAEVELAPVVNITDADKAIWSKFQRLSREERMTIINWARPKFGHIGMHNIQAVRAAWHEFHNPASCADEANLADIA